MSLFVVSFISFFSWFAYSTLGKRCIEKHNKLIINKIRKTVSLFAQHLHNILQNCSTDSSHQFCLIFKDNYIIFRQFENFSISLQSIKYFSYQEMIKRSIVLYNSFFSFFWFIWQMEWRFCPCWAWLIASLSSGRCPGLCAAAPAGRNKIGCTRKCKEKQVFLCHFARLHYL